MSKASKEVQVPEEKRLEEGDVLVIGDIVKLLNVSRTTVKRLMKDKELPLPHFHIGVLLKFDRRKVNEWYAQWIEQECETATGKRGNEREERTVVRQIRKATR